MALLTVKNLKKTFGKTEILKNIDLTLDAGETLSIIGPSGGGKTTLLRCLNLLEMPTDGKIIIGDEVIFDASLNKKYSDEEIRAKRRLFGLVFQNFNLFPQYTALENVTLAPLLQKAGTPEEVTKNCREILDLVGLSNKLDFYPHQLSGGQQQRVAIARALALNPKILFFDEPTSALDPELTGEVLRVIKQLAEQKTTMVIVTHEMSFARDVSTQTAFIYDGVIAEQGTPEQVFGNPQNQRLVSFLGKFSG